MTKMVKDAGLHFRLNFSRPGNPRKPNLQFNCRGRRALHGQESQPFVAKAGGGGGGGGGEDSHIKVTGVTVGNIFEKNP